VQTILFAVVLFFGSTLITAWVIGTGTATDNAEASLLTGLCWIVLFLCWYGWNVLQSARDIQDEQLARIENLEVALASTPRARRELSMAAMPGTYAVAGSDASVQHVGGATIPSGAVLYPGSVVAESLADRLIQFRIDGVKLRNETIQPEGFQEWKGRVDQWKANVIDAIKAQANLADVARFITLDRVPIVSFIWATDKRHTKALRELSRRIEILLEIMGKL
jgi:hypothetical protein